jgi:hypothetical protein
MDKPIKEFSVEIDERARTNIGTPQGYVWPLRITAQAKKEDEQSMGNFMRKWVEFGQQAVADAAAADTRPCVPQVACDTIEEAVKLWWDNLGKDEPTRPEVGAREGVYKLPLTDGTVVHLDVNSMRIGECEEVKVPGPVEMNFQFLADYGMKKTLPEDFQAAPLIGSISEGVSTGFAKFTPVFAEPTEPFPEGNHARTPAAGESWGKPDRDDGLFFVAPEHWGTPSNLQVPGLNVQVPTLSEAANMQELGRSHRPEGWVQDLDVSLMYPDKLPAIWPTKVEGGFFTPEMIENARLKPGIYVIPKTYLHEQTEDPDNLWFKVPELPNLFDQPNVIHMNLEDPESIARAVEQFKSSQRLYFPVGMTTEDAMQKEARRIIEDGSLPVGQSAAPFGTILWGGSVEAHGPLKSVSDERLMSTPLFNPAAIATLTENCRVRQADMFGSNGWDIDAIVKKTGLSRQFVESAFADNTGCFSTAAVMQNMDLYKALEGSNAASLMPAIEYKDGKLHVWPTEPRQEFDVVVHGKDGKSETVHITIDPMMNVPRTADLNVAQAMGYNVGEKKGE